MHDRHITPAEEEAQREQAILTMLLDTDAQRPWLVDEVARELACDRAPASDALTSLHRSGLIHGCGDFVWATRAALRASEINV
jgi:hypothetical protein